MNENWYERMNESMKIAAEQVLNINFSFISTDCDRCEESAGVWA